MEKYHVFLKVDGDTMTLTASPHVDATDVSKNYFGKLLLKDVEELIERKNKDWGTDSKLEEHGSSYICKMVRKPTNDKERV